MMSKNKTNHPDLSSLAKKAQTIDSWHRQEQFIKKQTRSAFCRERGIPTDRTAVIMRTEKNPETKMIVRISIELQLPPEFPQKYRNAVIRAVDQCPVKGHIMNPHVFAIEAKISA